jgi:transposase
LKREIVAASLAPGASVSVVARRYDVNANQVFSWRKRYPDGADGSTEVTRLLPVTIAVEDDGGAGQAAIGGEKIEIDVAAVNAASNFLRCTEVKFPSWAGFR